MAGKETKKSTRKEKKTWIFNIKNGKMGKCKPCKINWDAERSFPFTTCKGVTISEKNKLCEHAC